MTAAPPCRCGHAFHMHGTRELRSEGCWYLLDGHMTRCGCEAYVALREPAQVSSDRMDAHDAPTDGETRAPSRAAQAGP